MSTYSKSEQDSKVISVDSITDVKTSDVKTPKQLRREQYLKNKQDPEWIERKRQSAMKYYLSKKINRAVEDVKLKAQDKSEECKEYHTKKDDILGQDVKDKLLDTLDTLKHKFSSPLPDEIIIKDTLGTDGIKTLKKSRSKRLDKSKPVCTE
jgi:uncharacterized protein YcfJ